MRRISNQIDGYIVYAVSGTNTISFAIDFRKAKTIGLLGFAVERINRDTGDRKYMDGYKVFKIIIDAKENEYTDKKGNFHESFPRLANLEALSRVGIPSSRSAGYIIKRESKKNDIQHNKFIVKIDSKGIPKEVWTGSTNISLGGIHGQTNVGHLVRNEIVALQFKKYWDVLSTDPGSDDGDDLKTAKAKNDELRKEVEAIQKSIVFKDWKDIPKGITAVFSPRKGISMLETYFRMFDSANDMACVTLAFGINKLFKNYLKDNTKASHISFLLLEKEDKPNSRSKEPYLFIGSRENVYKSWGAYIEDDLCQWTKEKTTAGLGLNKHVMYIHSKFMLIDPLSGDPKVVTGSANFSDDSTTNNDENMLIIRGNKRVADIYFTEFNRLFNHYYFRSVYKSLKKRKKADGASLFLMPNDNWIKKYEEGTFRHKRVMMFTRMH